jgi:hypothetical protein
MAHRLPSELLHEIILLNDDNCSSLEGVTTNLRQPDCVNYYIKPKLKPCAGSTALVCTDWYSLVKDSPRLWVASFQLADSSENSEATDERMKFLQATLDANILSSNCDLDIFILCRELDNEWIVTSIASFLHATSHRWRFLEINNSAGEYPGPWLAFAVELSKTPRLRSLCYVGASGWLASSTQWRATMLDTINIYAGLDSLVTLPVFEDAFTRVFTTAKHGQIIMEIAHADSVNYIRNLYQLCSPTQSLLLKIDGNCDLGILQTDFRVDWVSGVVNNVVQDRKLSFMDTDITLVSQVLEAVEAPEVTSLSIYIAINNIIPHRALTARHQTTGLRYLELTIANDWLSSTFSCLNCTSLTSIQLSIHNLSREDVSLDFALPVLQRLMLRTTTWGNRSYFKTIGLGGLKAPVLQELHILGFFPDDPQNLPNIKPEFSRLRKMSFGVDQQSVLDELVLLATFDAPMLTILDISRCNLHTMTMSEIGEATGLIQDVLSRVDELHIWIPEESAVLGIFVNLMPELTSLNININSNRWNPGEARFAEIMTFLGSQREENMAVLPLLTTLGIRVYCLLGMMVQNLVATVSKRREAGVSELKHIRLETSQDSPLDRASCCSQLRDVLPRETTVEIVDAYHY